MRFFAILCSFMLAACAPADETPVNAREVDTTQESAGQQRLPAQFERASIGERTENEHGAIQQEFNGPGLVCGGGFAIVLTADETLVRNDPRIDFLTYHIEGNDGSFVLYEGNHPQPSDEVVETHLDWPSVIAIHENRPGDELSPVRERLLIGSEAISVCRGSGG